MTSTLFPLPIHSKIKLLSRFFGSFSLVFQGEKDFKRAWHKDQSSDMDEPTLTLVPLYVNYYQYL